MAAMHSATAFAIEKLDVFYGRSHALQEITLNHGGGILAVVGRNGMGKTTLCNAIAGLLSPARGLISLGGRTLSGMSPHRIARAGIGYVPQGRRLWPSLTVDEHLRMVEGTIGGGNWTAARIYDAFPRLAERRHNGGSQLSGGEQQMLAIGRALLCNPSLLVMDEPTEGLAPVIVDHVGLLLEKIVRDDGVSVLLIEQNLPFALSLADRVAIMINGRIDSIHAASALTEDAELARQLIGLSGASANASRN
ncbi:ABC transporter ATP-binding protein [Mesorhizobium sp. M1169]|uniref:ABC transporter ATP-binding protein n=1 Tax=Mesorhizobium sp. M1169 TaxID=2957066 RepID=UPI00333505F3